MHAPLLAALQWEPTVAASVLIFLLFLWTLKIDRRLASIESNTQKQHNNITILTTELHGEHRAAMEDVKLRLLNHSDLIREHGERLAFTESKQAGNSGIFPRHDDSDGVR